MSELFLTSFEEIAIWAVLGIALLERTLLVLDTGVKVFGVLPDDYDIDIIETGARALERAARP